MKNIRYSFLIMNVLGSDQRTHGKRKSAVFFLAGKRFKGILIEFFSSERYTKQRAGKSKKEE